MDKSLSSWKPILNIIAWSMLAPVVYAIAVLYRVHAIGDSIAGIFSQKLITASGELIFALSYSDPLYHQINTFTPVSFIPFGNLALNALVLFIISLCIGIILFKEKFSPIVIATALSTNALAGTVLFSAFYVQTILWSVACFLVVLLLLQFFTKLRILFIFLASFISLFDPGSYLIFLFIVLVIHPSIVHKKIMGLLFLLMGVFATFLAFSLSNIRFNIPWYSYGGILFVEFGNAMGLSLSLVLFGFVGVFLVIGQNNGGLTSLVIILSIAALFSPTALVFLSILFSILVGLLVEKLQELDWFVDWMKWVILMSIFCSLFISTIITVNQYKNAFPQQSDLEAAYVIAANYPSETVVLTSPQMQHLLERFSAAKGPQEDPEKNMDVFTISDRGIFLPYVEVTHIKLVLIDNYVSENILEGKPTGVALLVRDPDLFRLVYSNQNVSLFEIIS